MKVLSAGLLVLGFLMVSGLRAQEPTAMEPLTRTEFVLLVNEKTPVADIVAQVRARGIDFEVTPDLEASLQQVEGGEELLAALRAPATVELSVNVPGAEIVVDGEQRDPAPAQGPAVLQGLSPGAHLIGVQAERYVRERVDVFLKPGETRQLKVVLTPAVEVKPGPLGLEVNVKAGTKEDTLVVELETTADPAQRVAKLQDLTERYADTPLALLGYQMLQAAHLELEQFDAALAAGEKVLEHDPANYLVQLRQVQAYLGKGELQSAFDAADRARTLLAELRGASAPEGTDAGNWERQKKQAVENAEGRFQNLAYNFYVAAFEVGDPARKAAFLERFIELYPESDYRQSAAVNLAYAYQQQQKVDTALEWAHRALESNPDEGSMLVLVADILSDRGQDLGHAQQLASHLLERLGTDPETVRPAGMPDEQWPSIRRLWEGMARSALGQVLMHQETATAPTEMTRTRQAIDEFTKASPLLKAQTPLYARNLFRLGFAYAKVGELTLAQTFLNEVITLGTPYTEPAQQVLERVRAGLQRRKR